jgi:very-short-patch-repair endonuclease
MLIIEIDGSQHMNNKDYDDRRTRYLKANGFNILRFWNNEVLNQTNSVLEALTQTLSQREREHKE